MEPTPKSADPHHEADEELFAPSKPAGTEAMLAQLALIAARTAADRNPAPEPDASAGPRVARPLDIAPRPLAGNAPPAQKPRRTFTGIAAVAGVGAAVVLAWLSYGDAAKQMIAAPLEPSAASIPAPAPTNARASIETPALPAEAPVRAAAAAPAVPPELTQQIEAMARELSSLRQSVDQLTSDKEQMDRTIAKLQAAETKQAADKAAQEARRKAAAAAPGSGTPRGLGAPERPLGTLPAPRAPVTSSAPLPPTAQASALPPPPRRPPAPLPLH
jgi:hypothetical protein